MLLSCVYMRGIFEIGGPEEIFIFIWYGMIYQIPSWYFLGEIYVIGGKRRTLYEMVDVKVL